MAHCRDLLSSHADVPTCARPRSPSSPSPRWRFTFLQHGVIKDDLSRWLNPKKIDMFVTSTPPSIASIVGDDTPYPSPRRRSGSPACPASTGCARPPSGRAPGPRPAAGGPDLAQVAGPRQLAAASSAAASGRPPAASSCALARPPAPTRSSRDVCRSGRLTLAFLPHPNLREAGPRLDLPGPRAGPRPTTASTSQEHFARARVLVTDYSSVAFNAAYLDRPVVYYQFDGAGSGRRPRRPRRLLRLRARRLRPGRRQSRGRRDAVIVALSRVPRRRLSTRPGSTPPSPSAMAAAASASSRTSSRPSASARTSHQFPRHERAADGRSRGQLHHARQLQPPLRPGLQALVRRRLDHEPELDDRPDVARGGRAVGARRGDEAVRPVECPLGPLPGDPRPFPRPAARLPGARLLRRHPLRCTPAARRAVRDRNRWRLHKTDLDPLAAGGPGVRRAALAGRCRRLLRPLDRRDGPLRGVRRRALPPHPGGRALRLQRRRGAAIRQALSPSPLGPAGREGKAARVEARQGNKFWKRLNEHARTSYGWEYIDLSGEYYATFPEHPWGASRCTTRWTTTAGSRPRCITWLSARSCPPISRHGWTRSPMRPPTGSRTSWPGGVPRSASWGQGRQGGRAAALAPDAAARPRETLPARPGEPGDDHVQLAGLRDVLDEETWERVAELPRSADEHVAWIREVEEARAARAALQALGGRAELSTAGTPGSSTQGCR